MERVSSVHTQAALNHTPLVRVANALSGVRSGLIANSKIETVSKLTLIVLDFSCRALWAETPLLANDLAECGLTPFSIPFVS